MAAETSRFRGRLLALAAAMLAAQAAGAHSEKDLVKSAPKEAVTPIRTDGSAGTRDARTYFTDLQLTTQDGKAVRFYSDVLAGRTVMINVIYTNCQDACPLITRRMNEVRELVGEQFGKDVFFVTLTSDPVRDTPAALKQFAAKQQADVPGWIFLTGSKQNVDHILKKLGQFSDTVEAHSTLLIAGNVPAKRWSKIRPDAPPTAIAERLKLLVAGTAPVAPLGAR